MLSRENLGVFFLLAAHLYKAVAGAAVFDNRVFSLLLPVVFALRPWLARDLVSSSIMYSPWLPA
jgi:hypothetical protein